MVIPIAIGKLSRYYREVIPTGVGKGLPGMVGKSLGLWGYLGFGLMILEACFGAPLEKIRFYLRCLGGAAISTPDRVILSGAKRSRRIPGSTEGEGL